MPAARTRRRHNAHRRRFGQDDALAVGALDEVGLKAQGGCGAAWRLASSPRGGSGRKQCRPRVRRHRSDHGDDGGSGPARRRAAAISSVSSSARALGVEGEDDARAGGGGVQVPGHVIEGAVRGPRRGDSAFPPDCTDGFDRRGRLEAGRRAGAGVKAG